MLDIILAIICWFRGWRWKALIPPAITIGLGFITGMIYAVANIEVNSTIITTLFFINLIVWIVQVVMIFNPPSKTE